MKLALPRFYPIVDTATLRARGLPEIAVVEALLEAGVRILQFRHKEAWTEADYGFAEQSARLCGEAGALFVLNDRADFAALIGTAVHIGQNDLPAAAVRQIVGDRAIGFSTHNREQLERVSPEVDYVAVGPIFKTKSKANPDREIGLEGIRELRKLTQKSLVAIGGIGLETAGPVLAAGADSVAVIGGWMPEKADLARVREQAAEWLKL